MTRSSSRVGPTALLMQNTVLPVPNDRIHLVSDGSASKFVWQTAILPETSNRFTAELDSRHGSNCPGNCDKGHCF